MSGETYNGWTNYETWAVGMFLSGNYDGEGLYLEALDVVRSAADEPNTSSVWTDDEARIFRVSDALEEFTKDHVQSEAYEGLRGDLLGAALSEVDWRELAESKLAELAES